jgi:hypothetical protein
VFAHAATITSAAPAYSAWVMVSTLQPARFRRPRMPALAPGRFLHCAGIEKIQASMEATFLPRALLSATPLARSLRATQANSVPLQLLGLGRIAAIVTRVSTAPAFVASI